MFYQVISYNCFRPDNSCWCAFSNIVHLCVYSDYLADSRHFSTLYLATPLALYILCSYVCLFFGNILIPLSLCQYAYTSSLAISICLFYVNISMPLLWQHLYVSSMAISLPLLWQYIYVSSMAISLCLYYGNVYITILWQYIYVSSMAIYHCCYEQ